MPNQMANQKKKKNGRAPAHQNKFAFRHNPGSKKTKKILESPNVGLCRRCHDKIEWRKKYRKYKPRTQLGKCNICQQKNIKAAYHTICSQCAYDKSPFSLGEWKKEKQDCDEGIEEGPTSVACPDTDMKAEEIVEEKESHEDSNRSVETSSESHRKIRMCAMCTKEPVLTYEDQGEEDGAGQNVMSNLKLRERRTLERQINKREGEKRPGHRDEEIEEEELDDDSLDEVEDGFESNSDDAR